MKTSESANNFLRFYRPIVQALRENGGSGTRAEIIDRAIEILGLSPDEQAVTLPSGIPRVRDHANWAKYVLVKGGIVTSSERGVWSLTERGSSLNLESFDFSEFRRTVLKQVQAEKRARRDQTKQLIAKLETDDEFVDPTENHRAALLSLIRELPPPGFERLCRRLLSESGFEKVEVTGRSGDGGIDGIGILRLNAFVSFKVLFQCKRYEGSVSPSHIRDFRGAMMGRADKGILLTTGSFTVEAKKEARRDGAMPIELVDGDELITLFEKLRLGLTPRETFDVNRAFFDEFR